MSKDITKTVYREKSVCYAQNIRGHAQSLANHVQSLAGHAQSLADHAQSTVGRQLLFYGLALLITPSIASSAIYKTTDELGHPVYSDQPSDNNKPVKLNQVQTIQTKSSKITIITTSKSSDQQQKEEIAQYYKQLTIGFPHPDAVFENGPVTVTFVVNISPNLMGQHYIQLTKDGKVVSGPQSSMSLAISGLERGEHHFVPQIVDEVGKLIISGQGITIHVKQRSALHQNRAKPAQGAPK